MQKSVDAPGKSEKALITSKVTMSFSDSPCTPMAYVSFSRPTDFSRMIDVFRAIVSMKAVIGTGFVLSFHVGIKPDL